MAKSTAKSYYVLEYTMRGGKKGIRLVSSKVTQEVASTFYTHLENVLNETLDSTKMIAIRKPLEKMKAGGSKAIKTSIEQITEVIGKGVLGGIIDTSWNNMEVLIRTQLNSSNPQKGFSLKGKGGYVSYYEDTPFDSRPERSYVTYYMAKSYSNETKEPLGKYSDRAKTAPPKGVSVRLKPGEHVTTGPIIKEVMAPTIVTGNVTCCLEVDLSEKIEDSLYTTLTSKLTKGLKTDNKNVVTKNLEIIRNTHDISVANASLTEIRKIIGVTELVTILHEAYAEIDNIIEQEVKSGKPVITEGLNLSEEEFTRFYSGTKPENMPQNEYVSYVGEKIRAMVGKRDLVPYTREIIEEGESDMDRDTPTTAFILAIDYVTEKDSVTEQIVVSNLEGRITSTFAQKFYNYLLNSVGDYDIVIKEAIGSMSTATDEETIGSILTTLISGNENAEITFKGIINSAWEELDADIKKEINGDKPINITNGSNLSKEEYAKFYDGVKPENLPDATYAHYYMAKLYALENGLELTPFETEVIEEDKPHTSTTNFEFVPVFEFNDDGSIVIKKVDRTKEPLKAEKVDKFYEEFEKQLIANTTGKLNLDNSTELILPIMEAKSEDETRAALDRLASEFGKRGETIVNLAIQKAWNAVNASSDKDERKPDPEPTKTLQYSLEVVYDESMGRSFVVAKKVDATKPEVVNELTEQRNGVEALLTKQGFKPSATITLLDAIYYANNNKDANKAINKLIDTLGDEQILIDHFVPKADPHREVPDTPKWTPDTNPENIRDFPFVLARGVFDGETEENVIILDQTTPLLAENINPCLRAEIVAAKLMTPEVGSVLDKIETEKNLVNAYHYIEDELIPLIGGKEKALEIVDKSWDRLDRVLREETGRNPDGATITKSEYETYYNGVPTEDMPKNPYAHLLTEKSYAQANKTELQPYAETLGWVPDNNPDNVVDFPFVPVIVRNEELGISGVAFEHRATNEIADEFYGRLESLKHSYPVDFAPSITKIRNEHNIVNATHIFVEEIVPVLEANGGAEAHIQRIWEGIDHQINLEVQGTAMNRHGVFIEDIDNYYRNTPNVNRPTNQYAEIFVAKKHAEANHQPLAPYVPQNRQKLVAAQERKATRFNFADRALNRVGRHGAIATAAILAASFLATAFLPTTFFATSLLGLIVVGLGGWLTSFIIMKTTPLKHAKQRSRFRAQVNSRSHSAQKSMNNYNSSMQAMRANARAGHPAQARANANQARQNLQNAINQLAEGLGRDPSGKDKGFGLKGLYDYNKQRIARLTRNGRSSKRADALRENPIAIQPFIEAFARCELAVREYNQGINAMKTVKGLEDLTPEYLEGWNELKQEVYTYYPRELNEFYARNGYIRIEDNDNPEDTPVARRISESGEALRAADFDATNDNSSNSDASEHNEEPHADAHEVPDDDTSDLS